MKTLHLGPEELLVAVKVGVREGATATDVASAIDEAEVRVRAAVPIARVIYIEPDIFQASRAGGGSAVSGMPAARGGSAGKGAGRGPAGRGPAGKRG
jgi:hypothetical protein